MNLIYNYITNRDISLIFWGMLLFGWAVRNKDVRASFLQLLKTLLNWKILIVFGVMFTYIFIQLWIFNFFNLWRQTLIKDTTYWILTFAISMSVNINQANKDRSFFKKTLINILKLTFIIDFVINFYTFGLLGELIFIPIVVFLIMLYTYANTQDKYKPVSNLLKYVLGFFGSILLFYIGNQLITNNSELISIDNFRAILLPILLSISFIPYLYLLALTFTYEEVLTRFGFFIKGDKALYTHFRNKLILYSKLNLYKLIDFIDSSRLKIQHTNSIDEINKLF